MSRRKLLFVVSGDHGELSNAVYLTCGRDFDATLLLPERLHALNREGLPSLVRVEAYHGLADILATIHRARPDVVFLFSGYLYAINGILRPDEVETLVSSLQQSGLPFVTSDPFLGVLSHVDSSTFSDKHPYKAALTEHFTQLAGTFAGVRNFYPVPPDELLPVGSVSAYNPAIVADEGQIAGAKAWLAQSIGADPTRPWWLFVLANEDFLHQSQLHGEVKFRAIFHARLEDAARQGRQPIVVAPPVWGALEPKVEGLITLGYAGHRLFTSLLLTAEHAFYWNVLSNSTLVRALNHRSVFFFSRGHMAHAIRPMFDAGMRVYYRGTVPTELDPDRELRAVEIAGLAAQQDRDLEPLRERIRESPSPEAMVEGILNV